jgi:hypothetical protein
MSDDQHDHDRPGIADMKTALGTFRVVLDSADLKTAHEAAARGSCPVCVAVAGISFGITLASTVAGDTAFVNEPLRLALLAAVDAAERDLDSGSN